MMVAVSGWAESGFRPGARALAQVAALALGAMLTLAQQPAQAFYPKKGDAEPHHGVTAAKRMPIQGIDVSKWQQDIDWKEVRAAGTRFAFIKATEGGDLLDERFHENWREAKAAGVPRGAYHFVFWCRNARDQLRWFTRQVPRDPDALPPVLDVEWNNHSSCPRTTPANARAKMREMLKGFEAHYGKKPIIYTDINFHADVLEGTTEFNDYPFWIRSTAAPPQHRYENRPWEFWQFTTTGRVPGIRGDVDRNAFFGTARQFEEWRQGRFDIGTRRPAAEDAPKVARSPTKAPSPAASSAARPQPPATRPIREARVEEPRLAPPMPITGLSQRP
jgi:lysozyme